jgi:TonB family protein
MHPLIIYLIQVNLALVLFYLLYAFLFKRDTFLHLRRFYFISSIAFSLLYPLLVVPGLSDVFNFMKDEPKAVEAAVFFEAPTMQMVLEQPEEVDNSFSIPWKQVITVVYIAGTLFFISRFLWQLISIFRMRVKSKKVSVSGVEVYDLKTDITPFSFFGMVFINTEKHSEEELNQIIIHEQTHVKGKHSLDIMLIEVLLLVSWCNPFVWIFKREMAMNLEYLADKGVLREGVDSREYQYHLLRLTYHETAVQIVNNFNVSQLKQRIMMMNKTKSSSLKLAKYLLMLPMFFVLIAANSVYAGENEQNVNEPPPVKKEVTEEIFVVVEQQPEYPGGVEPMKKFLADSVRYPVIAKENGIQGRVIVNFVVNKDGSIDDVNIVRGVDPSIDAEAVRVIESMPKWKPGKQRGKEVDVRFTLPVVFRLNAPMDSDDDTSERGAKVIIDELMPNLVDMSVTASIQQTIALPGGQDRFMKYIVENIKYPATAQEKGVKGLVKASLKYNREWQIVSVKATPDSKEESILSDEVYRVIKGALRDVAGTSEMKTENTFLISGKVNDDRSIPIQGASVVLKGTNMGTITDSNGNFQLKVPSNDGSIDISFIGYKTEELVINKLKSSNGEMTTEIPVIFRLQGEGVESYDGPTPDNGVVVVGFGSQTSLMYKFPKKATSNIPDTPQDSAETNEIFVVVEEQPEFPGGNDAMMKYLADNVSYPVIAKENGIQGRVICDFLVRKDGSITDVKVARGVDPSIDKEAVRVIEQMPKWKPGMQRGQAVNVRYTLPVTFKLNNEPLSEAQKQEFQRIKDSVVEAKFPGGNDAYMKYLADNVRYPVIAQENGIQGLVVARYRILSSGKADFIDIVEGVDPSLEKEVQRLIDQMPDWTPTTIDGEATISVRSLPVVFRLQGEGVKSYDGPAPDNAVYVTASGKK